MKTVSLKPATAEVIQEIISEYVDLQDEIMSYATVQEDIDSAHNNGKRAAGVWRVLNRAMRKAEVTA